MKLFTVLPMLLASATLIAAPINSHSNNDDWSNATQSERSEYARYVVQNLDGTYQAADMLNCINKSFADKRNHEFKVSRIAGNCHSALS